MLKIIKKYLLLHRAAAFARSLSIASTPVIIAGCAVLLLHNMGWLDAPEKYSIPLILGLSALAWIPFYVKLRGSLLSVARRADTVMESGGIITAGTDMFSSGKPLSAWGRLVENHGLKILKDKKTSRIIPPRRYALFLLPLSAALLFALTCNYTKISAQVKKINWDEESKIDTDLHFFSAVDEKLLRKMQEKLKKDDSGKNTTYHDAKLGNLNKEIKNTLSTFPKTDEELADYIEKIEKLKKQIKDIRQANEKEQEILQEIGKKMDGKLLEELGKQLEQKNMEEAERAAEKIAENIEGKDPSSKSMEEAASNLAEGVKEGENKLAGEKQKDEKTGKESGEKEKGAVEKEGAKDGEGMDPDKFDKLKKKLEMLNKLAKMFNIKSTDQVPESMKDLGKEFSDTKLNEDQARQLQKMIGKLENLKNMMVEAKEGEGKGKYSDLRKQFEKEASGGKDGQPGQKGQGQPGATPEGKNMKPGEGEGEGSEKSMENPGGKQPGGKGKKGSEQPGDGSAQQDKADSKKEGQEGWGDGSAPHLGDPVGDGADTTYENMDVESKDSPGPIKKDVIKGAAENGFIGKDYKKVYENYSSIIEEILEEENVPSLYRYYVNKYFELISPRE